MGPVEGLKSYGRARDGLGHSFRKLLILQAKAMAVVTRMCVYFGHSFLLVIQVLRAMAAMAGSLGNAPSPSGLTAAPERLRREGGVPV